MATSDYYYGSDWNSTTFYNSLLASSVAIETYFSNILFNGDNTRIIYAENEYCFKERLRKEKTDLNIPFMNYYLKKSGITPDTSPRQLWNNLAHVQGILDINDYQEKLGYKLKVIPITLGFEGTAFFKQPFDTMYAQQKLNFQQANENILYGYYNTPVASGILLASGIDGYNLKVPMFLNYTPEYNPQYEENDFLEENQIMSIGLDFELITYLIFNDNTQVSITKEWVLDFISTKGEIDKTDPLSTDPKELLEIIWNENTS